MKGFNQQTLIMWVLHPLQRPIPDGAHCESGIAPPDIVRPEGETMVHNTGLGRVCGALKVMEKKKDEEADEEKYVIEPYTAYLYDLLDALKVFLIHLLSEYMPVTVSNHLTAEFVCASLAALRQHVCQDPNARADCPPPSFVKLKDRIHPRKHEKEVLSLPFGILVMDNGTLHNMELVDFLPIREASLVS